MSPQGRPWVALVLFGLGLSAPLEAQVFDTVVQHQGRGFEAFRHPARPADRGDGDLSGGRVMMHSGSFVFDTMGSDAINLGLDFVASTMGLHQVRETSSETDVQGPFGMPDGGNFQFVLMHDSQAGSPAHPRAFTTPAGVGWTHNYYVMITQDQDGSLLVTRGMRTDRYPSVGPGLWLATPQDTPGFYNQISQDQDGFFTLCWPHGVLEVFDPIGRLVEIRSRTGQRMLLDYGPNGLVQTIHDPLGRAYQFLYDPITFLLQAVIDFDGRQITLTHTPQGQLASITGPPITGTPHCNDFPSGRTATFNYGLAGAPDLALVDNVTAITFPNEVDLGGDSRIRVDYDADPFSPNFDRVVNFHVGGTAANGSTAGCTVTYAYDDGASPFLTTALDRNGHITDYHVNDLGAIDQIIEYTDGVRPDDPPAFVTVYDYNPDGERVQTIHPHGNVVQYFYDEINPDRAAHGNLREVLRLPDPGRGGDQPQLSRTFDYEPVYQQCVRVIEERGNDPTYIPPNGGAHDPSRYSWSHIFDYQEGNDVAGLAARRCLDTPTMQALLDDVSDLVPMDLGDVNGDGLTDQILGCSVQTPCVPVILASGLPQMLSEERHYNEFGQLISLIDQEGNKTNFEFFPSDSPSGGGPGPSSGFPFSSMGYLERVTYDAEVTPKRTESTPPAVIVNSFGYDARGNRTSFTDGLGQTDTKVYNAVDRVVQTTTESPFSYVDQHFFDANDNIVRVRIENKTPIVDASGNLIDPNGVGTPTHFESIFVYDILDHEIERHLDATGSTPSTLTTLTAYDPNENVVRTTLPEGNKVDYAYDERDLLFEETRGADSADAATRTFNYDLNGNLAETVDAEDTDGDGLRERDQKIYDGYDRVVTLIDGVGNRTELAYDPASNRIQEQVWGHPPGPTPLGTDGLTNILLEETNLLHDELRRVFQRDQALFIDSATTLSIGTITEGTLTPGDGAVSWQYIYDRNSRLVEAKDDEEDITSYEYDGMNRLVREVDPVGNEVTYEHDANNNLTRLTETDRQPQGEIGDQVFITDFVYDELDRIAEEIRPLGHTQRFFYDSRNNIVFHADANDGVSADSTINGHGNTREYVYDGASRLLETRLFLREGGLGNGALDLGNPFNPDGIIRTTQTFDGNSLLRSQTDDRGNTTSFEYNARNVKVRRIHADGTTEELARDLDNNVATRTNANGSQTSFQYDGLNRHTLVTIVRGSGIEGTTAQTFEYDGHSRLRRVEDNNDPSRADDDTECHYAYDSLSRVVEERQNPGSGERLSGSELFGETRRTALHYPNGQVLQATFDAFDRETTLRWLGEGTDLMSYFYIGKHRTHRRVAQNGVELSVVYDGKRRITSYDHTLGFQTLIGFDRFYDREDNTTRIDLEHLSMTDLFEYDSRYRLTDAQYGHPLGAPNVPSFQTTYALDGTHNWRELTRLDDGQPLSQDTSSVNEMNEYTTFANTSESHDANGNLIELSIFDEDDVLQSIRRFSYDALDRLVRVDEEEGGTNRVLARYWYDAQGHRVGRETFSSVSAGASRLARPSAPALPGSFAQTTYFFYDGWRAIEEQDARGVTKAYYAFGSRHIDETLTMDRRVDGVFDRFFMLEDPIFSVYGVTDRLGQMQETVRYDAYGRAFFDTDTPTFDANVVGIELPSETSRVGNPHLFAGFRLDPETGFYYARNRQYRPEQGRFSERDPLGSIDSLNLYEYVKGGPLDRLDPFGTDTWYGYKTGDKIHATQGYFVLEKGNVWRYYRYPKPPAKKKPAPPKKPNPPQPKKNPPQKPGQPQAPPQKKLEYENLEDVLGHYRRLGTQEHVYWIKENGKLTGLCGNIDNYTLAGMIRKWTVGKKEYVLINGDKWVRDHNEDPSKWRPTGEPNNPKGRMHGARTLGGDGKDGNLPIHPGPR